MQKKYMRSYMQESDHPLADAIRQAAVLKAEAARAEEQRLLEEAQAALLAAEAINQVQESLDHEADV